MYHTCLHVVLNHPPLLLQVSNEAEIIASLKGAYPDEKVVVFTGSDHSVTSTIELFRRAKVVVGMHGAGLSHMIFSAPGTAVVEFLFMYDPPHDVLACLRRPGAALCDGATSPVLVAGPHSACSWVGHDRCPGYCA